jgi:hypothetical protein
VFAQVRRALLSRLCAAYFIAAIVVPTTAPFRAVTLSELVRRTAALSGRVAPVKDTARDTALASRRLRSFEHRLKNRLKVIAGVDQSFRTIPADATSVNAVPDSRVTAHLKPLPTLRI